MSAVDRAVEHCSPIVKYHVSPFKCYYYNPRKYTPVALMKWAQKYVMNRQYMTLIEAAQVMGMEPVPGELVMRNALRDGFNHRRVKIGRLSFYLLKSEEMSPALKGRFQDFKQSMTSILSKSLTL